MSVSGQIKQALGFTWILDVNDRLQKRILEAGIHERAETEVLPQFVPEGGVALDIGANIGYYTLLLSKMVGPRGHVHALEPLDLNYEKLVWHVRNNSLTNVTTHKCAAGDTPSLRRVQFSLPSGPVNLGGFHLFGRDCRQGENGVEITTVRIDDVIEEWGIDRLQFMKIDVEGYEAMVLSGATKTIARFKPTIMIEILDEACAKTGTDARALVQTLRDLGYGVAKVHKKPASLVPVSEEDFQPPVHFNAICTLLE